MERIVTGKLTLDDFLCLFLEEYDLGKGVVRSLLYALDMTLPETVQGVDGAATLYGALLEHQGEELQSLKAQIKELEDLVDALERPSHG
jgi:hypothetical protein